MYIRSSIGRNVRRLFTRVEEMAERLHCIGANAKGRWRATLAYHYAARREIVVVSCISPSVARAIDCVGSKKSRPKLRCIVDAKAFERG